MDTYNQKLAKILKIRGGANNKGFSLSKSQSLAPNFMNCLELFSSVQVSISLFLDSLFGQFKLSPVFSVLHNSDEKKGSPQEGGSRFSAISLHFTNLMFLALFIFMLGISTSCSVKKDDEVLSEEESRRLINQQNQGPVDTDKDGLSDITEKQLGRDHLIGTFPKFTVHAFNKTSITVRDFTQDDNDLVIDFILDENTGRDLSYDPIRDKIARYSYKRVIGQPEIPDPVGVFDLGVVKISNFSHVDYIKMKNYLFQNDGQFDAQAINISSRFFIKASGIKGIKKISNVMVQLGFVSGNGAFETFGSTGPLLSADKTRAIFTSKGDSDSAITNQELLLYVDRLPVGTLSTILGNNYDLALKIVDYDAEMLDGRTFTLSKTITQALSAGTFYSVSTPSINTLFFNTRTESVSTTLKRLFSSDADSDGEGTLLRLGSLANTTTQPVIFEDGGNSHLKSSAWYLFSKNDKISDVPQLSDSIMSGYFKNSFLAQSAGRIIKKRIYKEKSLNVTKEIAGLNIGETVKVRIKGSEIKPYSSPVRERSVRAKGLTILAVCIGPIGGDIGGDVFIVKPQAQEKRQCRRVNTVETCQVRWSDYLEEILPIDFYSKEKLNFLEFTSRLVVKPIPLTNSSFFKKNPPIKDLQSTYWEFRFKVDEQFLREFGESIKLNIPTKAGADFTYSLHGDIDCHRRVFQHSYEDPNIVTRTGSSSAIRDLEIEVIREF